ncbi:MAG: FG-GAP-like repeat-containing protein [Limisphaerales bacterium]
MPWANAGFRWERPQTVPGGILRFVTLIATTGVLILSLAGCGRERASLPAENGRNADGATGGLPERFFSLMTAGKNHLERGDATNAVALYREAAGLVPQDADVHLNLAIAHLTSDEGTEALRETDEVLRLDPNSAAAWFVRGSAHLRLAQAEEAVKALENARRIDPGEPASCFQLGKARMELKQWDDAIVAFREGLSLDPNHLHAAVHYLLGQSLLRAGRTEEARKELEQHQAGLEVGGAPTTAASFERSRHTQPRVPFRLNQPDPGGIAVRFVDATREVLGEGADLYAGPAAVIDVEHTGWNSMFVQERGRGFRWLRNSGGVFRPHEPALPAVPGRVCATALVGDLENDRREDVIVLGNPGSHLFRWNTNGVVEDVSQRVGFDSISATHGALMDLDFTGKLDLITVDAAGRGVRLFRQQGPLRFTDITAESGIPEGLRNVGAVAFEDWNKDGSPDVVASGMEGPPVLLEKQRGGKLASRSPTNWVAGGIACTGDFDNDLRPDLAVADARAIRIFFQSGAVAEIPWTGSAEPSGLLALDHDNDGWLDLWSVGQGVRAWRNRGLSGWDERTTALGLDGLGAVAVSSVHPADFDGDCDPDLVIALAGGGLRYLRNEGGNGNGQVKVRLIGNRSNASGLGCRVEIETGGLRLIRTVTQLPVEIGVGRHAQLDSFLVHWFNWPQGSAGAPVDCREPFLALEATLQEGSCPYLYAWDGGRFRFVTDILGAAPLGLPMARNRYIEADPEEWVWIGDENGFVPRNGAFEVRITEELREVLYLDEARLAVVDHPAGTEVHPIDKLLPGGPFPAGGWRTLHRERPLRRAETIEGDEVTAALRSVDGKRVSPPRLRVPQLRGLAEPHGWILDFGPLDAEAPLVLVMNGWLRFGGGMANIAASHDPSLPFPFPELAAEVAPGIWEPVDVVVGAPAGKTKTILVDLEGRLKPGTRRLRLTSAFEIHWDRIALLEKFPESQVSGDGRGNSATRGTMRAPSEASLGFRGFSRLLDLPPDCPPTPDYDDVRAESCWTVLPGGWCTRYGDVGELVGVPDEGLVLVHSGDELKLRFNAATLPPKPAGAVRDFFLVVDGWDKDADFHVAAGTRVGPLPFHGMNGQRYGEEPRPAFPSDELHRRYNTRWVDGKALQPAEESGR